MRIVSYLRHGPAVACGLVGLAYLVVRLAGLQDHRPAVALYTVAALAGGYFGGPRVGGFTALLGTLGLALHEGLTPGLLIFLPVGALAAYLGDQCLGALRTAGRFRDTFAQMRDAVVTADETGRVVALNAAAQTLIGRTSADAVGQPLETVFALADSGAGKSAVERIRNMGGHALPPEEVVLVGQDGAGRPIEFWAEPVREGVGQHGDVLVFFREVSVRRAAEGELRQREDRFRALAAQAAAGLMLLDHNGDCIFTNPAAQAVGGFNAVEALGAGWTRTLAPEDAAVADEWSAAARAGRPYVREFRFVDGAGVRWVRLRAEAARTADGQPLEHVGTLEDVTTRKRLEAELAEQTQAEASRQEAEEAGRRALEEAQARHEEQVAALRAAGQELGQRLLERDHSLDEMRHQLAAQERSAAEVRQLLEQERAVRTQNEAQLREENAAARSAHAVAEGQCDEHRRAAEEARSLHGRDRSAWETTEADLRQQLSAVESARQRAAAALEEARKSHAQDHEAWEQTEKAHAEEKARWEQTDKSHAEERAGWHQAEAAFRRDAAVLADGWEGHERDRAAWASAEAGHLEKIAALEEAHRQVQAHLAESQQRADCLHGDLRKAAEHREQAAKHRRRVDFYRTVLERLPAAVLVWDAKNTVDVVNRTAHDLLGSSEVAVFAELPLVGLDGAPLPAEHNPFVGAEQRRSFAAVEFVWTPSAGGPRTLAAWGEPLRDDHAADRGFVLVLHDLTNHRQCLLDLQTRHAEQQRLLEEWNARHARHVEETEAARLRWRHDHALVESTARTRAAFLADAGRRLAEVLDLDAALVAAASTVVPFLTEGCVVLGPAADGLAVEALAIVAEESVLVRDRREVATWTALPLTLLPDAGLLATVPDALAAAVADWTQLAVGRPLPPTTAILLPMAVADGVQGVVLFFRGAARPPFSAEDLAVAEEYVHRASLAIAAAARRHDLRTALAARPRPVEAVAIPAAAGAMGDGYPLVERLAERARPLLARIGEVAERLATWESRTREKPAAIIEGAAARLTALLESAETAAQVVRNGLIVHRLPVELGPLVERAARACYPVVRAREKHLTVSLPLHPDWVIADPVRLEQALGAVLDNAAQHATAGGQVHLTTERHGDAVAIRIRDDGPGLADGDLVAVTALSARAGRLWPRPGEGLGLGLALTRSLVELQGGRLDIHSSGAGVEVVVHLSAVARGRETLAAVAPPCHDRAEAGAETQPSPMTETSEPVTQKQMRASA